jgi:hypothetical protein
MSVFMSTMESVGLSDRPPESKVPGVLRRVLDVDELGLIRAALRHPEEHPHLQPFNLLAADDGGLDAGLARHLLRGLGEPLGVDDVGGLVDQVARPVGGLRHPLTERHRLLVLLLLLHARGEGQPHRGQLRRVLVFLGRGLVALEAVGAQLQALHHGAQGGDDVRRLGHGEHHRAHLEALGRLRGTARRQAQRLGRVPAPRAQAQQHQALRLEPSQRVHHEGLIAFALEALLGGGGEQLAAQRRVGTGQRRGRLVPDLAFEEGNDEHFTARACGLTGDEAEVHEGNGLLAVGAVQCSATNVSGKNGRAFPRCKGSSR